MLFFYNDERAVDLVIGQVEPTGGPSVFGVQLEGQAISQFHFDNDVIGMLSTSAAEGWQPSTRIIGTDGQIEVALRTTPLRTWLKGETEWQAIELSESNSLRDNVALGVLDLVQSLKDGVEPELSSRKVLKATELIFGTYESAR